MANFRRLFSVTIVISLLLSIGVLFISQLATAGDGEGKPEESTLYEASKSWDGAEPNIDVDQDHLDFACSVGGSTPNMAATLNQLDFECTTPTLSSYEIPPNNDKIEIMLIDSPPTPPVNVSHTMVNVGHLTASAVILNDVPTSEWTYGCTATSAGMLFGYYDRTGYPNMYTGSTNGGVCPLTDLGQGIPTNPRYPIPGSCYIISTENGLDGISSNAHVDDYWISYGSAGPDPWEGNWPEHTWGLCTADFLGTNQWKWDYSSYPGTDGNIDSNGDGSTTIWNYNDGSKLYDWCPGPAYGIPTTSCCHGMRLFAESRGYSVDANYNQLTDNQNSNGFTFAEFQSEINAGRPVLIHVIGHTMVGIGYDTATNSIYIHDTWDNNIHSMTWGGSYAGMDLYAVTVIHLASPTEYSLTISSTSGGSVTTPGEGTFTYDEGTVVDLVATPGAGYLFHEWTGDVGTIADVNAATTTITMNGDYSITANFIVNTPPEVSSVSATQRSDGSGIVDISYDVSDNEQSTVDVSLEYWDPSGSWHSCTNTAGDVGPGINTGTGKAATWDTKAQLGAAYISGCKVRVTAGDGVGGTDSEESNTFDLDTAPPTGYGCASPEDEAECVSVDEALVCSTASDDSAPIEYKFAIASDVAFSQDPQESDWQQSTNWTPTTALSYGKAYWWRVKARDAKNNESAWSTPFTFVTIYKFDLALKSGWNMISLPLESCTGETDPAVILPDVEVIYTWNCETTSYDSPSEIVPGKGYWALVFEDVAETIYGTPVEEYQLSSDCEGWHMVGSLYVDGQVNVGSGSVYGSLYHWNPETLSYIARPLDEVRPGEGYCLLAFTNFSISVVPKPPVP